MSVAAAHTDTRTAGVVGYDPLRDSRHRDARSARDQADWLAWLELGGIRPRTLEDYEWATARAMRMFPDKTLAEFTDGDILHVARDFPAASRRVRMAAFESWFKWGVKTRRITANPMDTLPDLKPPKRKVIDVFTRAEVAQLVGLPERDGTLMRILLDAGLRKGEARTLQARHVRPEPMPGALAIIDGKGGKDRLVQMTGRLASAVAEYQFVEGMGDRDFFWYDRPGGGRDIRRSQPIGETVFARWWKRCLDDAGVRYRNPHTTRHTFATNWLRSGARLSTLSEVMGHSSIKTTDDLYSHLDQRDIAVDLALIEAEG